MVTKSPPSLLTWDPFVLGKDQGEWVGVFCPSFFTCIWAHQRQRCCNQNYLWSNVSSVLCMNLFLSQKLTIFEGTENRKDEFCQTRWFQWLFSLKKRKKTTLMWSACSENVMICFDLNRMNKLYGKLDRATKSLIFFTSRGWEVELDFMIVFTFYNMFLKSMFGLIMTIDVMWTHERILIEMGEFGSWCLEGWWRQAAVLHEKNVFMVPYEWWSKIKILLQWIRP